jgi:hypothetical protein
MNTLPSWDIAIELVPNNYFSRHAPGGWMYRGRYMVSFRRIVDQDAIMHVGFRANLNRTQANSRKAMLRSRGASPGNLGTKRLLWKQIARFK